MRCYVCKSSEKELRPYGTYGQPICHPCMASSPMRKAEAIRQLRKATARAARMGNGMVAIGGPNGPEPLGVPSDKVVH